MRLVTTRTEWNLNRKTWQPWHFFYTEHHLCNAFSIEPYFSYPKKESISRHGGARHYNLAIGRLRQEDCKFKVIICHTARQGGEEWEGEGRGEEGKGKGWKWIGMWIHLWNTRGMKSQKASRKHGRGLSRFPHQWNRFQIFAHLNWACRSQAFSLS